MSSEAVVTYFEGMWHAESDGVVAEGYSPEEAVRRLAEISNITLAQPNDEDWINPYNL